MRNFERWMFIGGASLVMAATGLTGCATHSDERTTSQKWDDHATAHRVKKELSKSPIYKFNDVGVSAFEGQVQLNGFVNTDEQKRLAEQLARNTPGVGQVINNIAIKEEPLVPTGRASQPNPDANPPANPPAPRNNPQQY
jgi:hyperosmotically inducible protein